MGQRWCSLPEPLLMVPCGGTSSPGWSRGTAASPSTCLSARIRIRSRSAPIDRRLLWPGSCSIALTFWAWTTPRWSPTDTAGGLLLLSLASGHPGLGTITRLVLTNCDSYDQFPPDTLKKVAALCRRQPRLPAADGRPASATDGTGPVGLASVTAAGLDDELTANFFGPGRRVPGVLDDLVGAMAGSGPSLPGANAAAAISGFNRPVMLIFGVTRTASSPWRARGAAGVRLSYRIAHFCSWCQDMGADRQPLGGSGRHCGNFVPRPDDPRSQPQQQLIRDGRSRAATGHCWCQRGGRTAPRAVVTDP